MTKQEAIKILNDGSVYHPLYLDALNMAIDALTVDVRCSRVETQELVVTGGINHNFKSCDKCKYCELKPEVCRLMGCIHAWSEMRDCYKEVKE